MASRQSHCSGHPGPQALHCGQQVHPQSRICTPQVSVFAPEHCFFPKNVNLFYPPNLGALGSSFLTKPPYKTCRPIRALVTSLFTEQLLPWLSQLGKKNISLKRSSNQAHTKSVSTLDILNVAGLDLCSEVLGLSHIF